MNPFILQFKEIPASETLDYSIIEYSDELNLSINKKTKKPAVDILTMDTATETKAMGESSDSDMDRRSIQVLLDTSTFTKADGEDSDPDESNGLNMHMDTSTRTFVEAEDSDSDVDRKSMQALMDTSTLTESREDTDQDK